MMIRVFQFPFQSSSGGKLQLAFICGRKLVLLCKTAGRPQTFYPIYCWKLLIFIFALVLCLSMSCRLLFLLTLGLICS